MERRWFNSVLSYRKLEYWHGINKSMGCIPPIQNSIGSGGSTINDREKNIDNWSERSSYSSPNVDYFFGVMDILSLISDDTFFVRDGSGNTYSVYFDVESQIFEIDNDSSFLSKLESFFSSYLNSNSGFSPKDDNRDDDCYMYDTKCSWNMHINSSIDTYLSSEIRIDSYISSNSDYYNYNDSYIYTFILSESVNDIESESSGIKTSTNDNDSNTNNTNIKEKSNDNDFDVNKKYRHLWIQCENCYGLNYKKLFQSKMNICEQCGYHLKMSSSDRIELSIDPGTWDPMDEDMVSIDPIEFHSEEEPYKDRLDSYQRKTGLTEAVQTGVGQLNGIPVAIGVMDFQFMGGSMGSVVGEKITRLIEYATNRSLPVIIVCASGGARMQEGSLSLMQMAKISSVLYNYQSNKKLFYVSILTSPTTGGVTASFGMLGDIIIAEPNAYIAFAGKRVIEQTLNKTVPEGSQAAEYLFHNGLLDLIVPRNPLKGVLSEFFQLHGFFPLNFHFNH